MLLCEFINAKRKEKNITIDELVKLSKVPKSTLSKITAGINDNPTLNTVTAICDALGCTLNDVMGYQKSSPSELTDDEQTLIDNYRNLNDNYKGKVFERVKELTVMSKYDEFDEYSSQENVS